MGDLTRHLAKHRLRQALAQRLEDTSTRREQKRVYDELVNELLDLAIDEEALHRIGKTLAAEPGVIDFPDKEG